MNLYWNAGANCKQLESALAGLEMLLPWAASTICPAGTQLR
jgi:hypothetical protein